MKLTDRLSQKVTWQVRNESTNTLGDNASAREPWSSRYLRNQFDKRAPHFLP